MGILSSYIENGTKLKSLKFGNDNSFTAEPFIQTPIPSDTDVVSKPKTSLAAYGDGVIRGSLISIQRSATDVLRLTKYMASPSGIQFTLKQNLLSRVSPETEASGKFLNEGIYTPLSTLAQAGVGILGIHLNKQGLLPTSLKKYGEVVYKLGQDNPNTKVTNRLVNLHFESIENPDAFSLETLYKYKGGPGSVLGLGKTYIQYATKGDGVTPQRLMGSNGLNPKSYLVPGGKDPINLPSVDDAILKESIKLISEKSFSSPILNLLPSSSRELLMNPKWFDKQKTFSAINVDDQYHPLGTYSSEVTLKVDPLPRDATPSTKYETLNQGGRGYLANLNKNVGYFESGDMLVYGPSNLQGAARNIGPDFRKVDRKIRGFIDPESRYDYITAKSGKEMESLRGDYFTEGQANKVVDRIYYTTSVKRTSAEFGSKNDLIEFSISIISPLSSTPEKLYFRAYIDNFSDSYNPEWNSQTYMGRGEKFYKYNSFDRKISLGFTVAAEGKGHLLKMYSHLNQLASSLAPSYTTQGYMAGNLHKLTVGNYVSNQYGIITGLTYDIIEESPWNISPNQQLPMYIKVTGFQFTPIHDFRPEYINLTQNTPHTFINPEYIQKRNVSGKVDKINPTITKSIHTTPPKQKPNTSGTTDSGLKPVFK